MVREKARDANQMNWDKKKQCFYLVYNKYRAYVVQAMNMMFVGPPYFEAIKGTTEAELRADFSICPDVKEYGPSAPSPTPSLATFGR